MDERELLELAAKAAGIDLSGAVWSDSGTFIFWAPRIPNWNPLKSDGDAFRLMVKLGIDLEFKPSEIWSDCTAFEERGGDDAAATRLVIVKAAAAIGRGMK